MLIEKLKQHLINTPLAELRAEWKSVEQYANIGPFAIDLVQFWRMTYIGMTPPNINCVLKDKHHKEIKNETPSYSEFFFNIVLWKI